MLYVCLMCATLLDWYKFCLSMYISFIPCDRYLKYLTLANDLAGVTELFVQPTQKVVPIAQLLTPLVSHVAIVLIVCSYLG